MSTVTVPLVRRRLLDAFGRALPVVNWAFFGVGLIGAVGTLVGALPPYSNSWWARLTTVLLWLLFAREGYESLAEQEADERG